eukprot:7388486-Prymnesium_polylepis.1
MPPPCPHADAHRAPLGPSTYRPDQPAALQPGLLCLPHYRRHARPSHRLPISAPLPPDVPPHRFR